MKLPFKKSGGYAPAKTFVSQAVVYKTVEAFSGLTAKKLWIKDDPKVATDGNMISAPLGSAFLARFVEKMLSHILFQTNVAALQEFSQAYAQQIANVCSKAGLPLHVEQVENLREMLLMLCKVFEAHRVSTLWSMIYAGSGEALKPLTQQAAIQHLDKAHQNFILFATLKQAGLPIAPGAMSAYEHIVDQALDKVAESGPPATMAVAKWTLIQVISELIGEGSTSLPTGGGAPPPAAGPGQGPGERASALKQFIQQGHALPSELEAMFDQVKPSDFKGSYAANAAKALAIEALQAPVNDDAAFEEFLSGSTKLMLQAVEKAKNMTTTAPPQEEWARKDSGAKVVFHDITPEQVAEFIQKSHKKMDPNPCAPLTGEDRTTSQRLRSLFQQVRNRRKLELYASGLNIDAMASIQYMLSGQQQPVFKSTTSGRGFDILLLMDRSSSMGGEKKKAIERAGRILADALAPFPFVRLHIWGFQSLEIGQVDIFRFNNKLRVYDAETAIVGGHTPLHVAVRVASRFLMEGATVKHMVVLTDCVPNFHRRDGVPYNRNDLIQLVRQEVLTARVNGIQVTGAIVPNVKKVTSAVGYVFEPDLSTRDHVRLAFGSGRNWSYINAEQLGPQLIQLISQNFVQYLQAA